MFEYDLCVVGTGRVGLPLALSLADTGLSVVGVDRDASLRAAVAAGRMPFDEPGYDALVARGLVAISDDLAAAGTARSIVVTVGTPLHNHVETDLGQVRAVLEGICPHLRSGQLLCLRSTVAPGTTNYVARWIERHTSLRVGEDFYVAFCPERIVEGKAFEELRTLPQIVGAEDPRSADLARELFGRLTGEVMQTDFVSAELVKLFNNVSRYVSFALANHLALVADTFEANIFEIRRLTNHNYPRQGVAAPGFTAGTCLRKDFGMINEWTPYPDLLLSAWKMNEYMPMFVVQHLKKRVPIFERRVAVLGYTFKAESDDTRDSLVPKLVRYIERELPLEVRVAEPHLGEEIVDPPSPSIRNWATDEALSEADCVFVATNHESFRAPLRALATARPDAWVADLWNLGGLDKLFYQARELRSVL